MGVHPEQAYLNPELDELRILTEVENILSNMDSTGYVPPNALHDIRTNHLTATYEIAMPSVVSEVTQLVEYEATGEGQRQRVIKWLGESVLAHIEKGKQYHWSEVAHARVDVEVAANRYEQARLQAGRALPFISPKMSRHDAPLAVAKSEHLHADDSIRVSTAITNDKGEVTGRLLRSVLVRDIPLDAWVAMLKDSNNIFGRALPVRDELSALSVMELFQDMELAESDLPEGPVSLIAAVLPYIKDNDQYDSVDKQLAGFRIRQEDYKRVAESIADEWLEFDIELAKSILAEKATSPVRTMIMQLSHEWDDTALAIINRHALGDTQYVMTKELATVLERAKRKLLTDRAAILVGSADMIKQARDGGNEQLVIDIQANAIMYQNGLMTQHEHAQRQAELDRGVAKANLTSDRGCPGNTEANFQKPDNDINTSATADKQVERSDWEKGKRKWKKGVCQVKICSSPKPTEVGPCSVCKNCQAVFDQGGDPTKSFVNALTAGKQPQDDVIEGPATTRSEQKADVEAQINEVFAKLDIEKINAEENNRRLSHRQLASVALAH